MFNESSEIDGRVYNQAFIEKLRTDGPQKVAAELTGYTRKQLREDSFARPILGSEPITPLELDKTVNTKTPVKIIDLEPDTKAFALTFRGEADAQWFEGERYEVNFAHYESEHFKITLGELATYSAPIKKIIHDNHLLDVREKEDGIFVKGLDVVVAKTGNIHTASGFTISEISKAAKMITDNKLEPVTILLSNSTYQDLKTWQASDMGDHAKSEVIVNGWTYEKIGGYNYVKTVKTDIVPDGVLYIFTAPEFLGKHFVLNDIQVVIKQEGHEIEMWAWEDVGMSVGNVNSVVKMTWIP